MDTPDESTAQPTTASPAEPRADPPTEAPDERDARIAELDDRWRRAAADLDNVRKRGAREVALVRDAERARAASVFLPVVDGLGDALSYARQVNDPLTDGIASIREQAVVALELLGYPRIDAVGVPFDPRIHEAVSVVDRDDVAPQTVVAVVRLGFGAPERLLRPASVVVARAPE